MRVIMRVMFLWLARVLVVYSRVRVRCCVGMDERYASGLIGLGGWFWELDIFFC